MGSDFLPPVERAAAGRTLGLLGDPRPGVGVVLLPSPHGEGPGVRLPDIDWVRIPAGEFTYQKGRMTLDYDFEIARYPITNAQFQTFIDDPEGFYDPRWWEGLSLPEGHNAAPGEQALKYDNHPRETVSWYDAIAFCRWWSRRLEALTPNPSPSGRGAYDPMNPSTWAVRLPTEFEWEKAARAHSGWNYPYGDTVDPAKGNTDKASIRQTSAVGLFPAGDTPHWSKPISDLSGNVWEWCLSAYDEPQADVGQENIRSEAARVLRGGSWSYYQVGARAVYRVDDHPLNRDYDLGFRVVCVGVPSRKL
jgi:formylglycine-generating enzyme required for sulfatase activity